MNDINTKVFGIPFEFMGCKCENTDELLKAIYENWDYASVMLRSGEFHEFYYSLSKKAREDNNKALSQEWFFKGNKLKIIYDRMWSSTGNDDRWLTKAVLVIDNSIEAIPMVNGPESVVNFMTVDKFAKTILNPVMENIDPDNDKDMQISLYSNLVKEMMLYKILSEYDGKYSSVENMYADGRELQALRKFVAITLQLPILELKDREEVFMTEDEYLEWIAKKLMEKPSLSLIDEIKKIVCSEANKERFDTFFTRMFVEKVKEKNEEICKYLEYVDGAVGDKAEIILDRVGDKSIESFYNYRKLCNWQDKEECYLRFIEITNGLTEEPQNHVDPALFELQGLINAELKYMEICMRQEDLVNKLGYKIEPSPKRNEKKQLLSEFNKGLIDVVVAESMMFERNGIYHKYLLSPDEKEIFLVLFCMKWLKVNDDILNVFEHLSKSKRISDGKSLEKYFQLIDYANKRISQYEKKSSLYKKEDNPTSEILNYIYNLCASKGLENEYLKLYLRYTKEGREIDSISASKRFALQDLKNKNFHVYIEDITEYEKVAKSNVQEYRDFVDTNDKLRELCADSEEKINELEGVGEDEKKEILLNCVKSSKQSQIDEYISKYKAKTDNIYNLIRYDYIQRLSILEDMLKKALLKVQECKKTVEEKEWKIARENEEKKRRALEKVYRVISYVAFTATCAIVIWLLRHTYYEETMFAWEGSQLQYIFSDTYETNGVALIPAANEVLVKDAPFGYIVGMGNTEILTIKDSDIDTYILPFASDELYVIVEGHKGEELYVPGSTKQLSISQCKKLKKVYSSDNCNSIVISDSSLIDKITLENGDLKKFDIADTEGIKNIEGLNSCKDMKFSNVTVVPENIVGNIEKLSLINVSKLPQNIEIKDGAEGENTLLIDGAESLTTTIKSDSEISIELSNISVIDSLPIYGNVKKLLLQNVTSMPDDVKFEEKVSEIEFSGIQDMPNKIIVNGLESLKLSNVNKCPIVEGASEFSCYISQYKYEHLSAGYKNIDVNGGEMTTITLEEGVKHISILHSDNLKEIVMPSTIEEVFVKDCESLEKIIWPSGFDKSKVNIRMAEVPKYTE